MALLNSFAPLNADDQLGINDYHWHWELVDKTYSSVT